MGSDIRCGIAPIAVLAALIAGGAGVSGCQFDDEADLLHTFAGARRESRGVVKFGGIRVVSAVPLVARNGSAERSCRVSPEDVVAGLEIAVVLAHTDPNVDGAGWKPTCAGERDRDWSVRPGDRIEGRRIAVGETIATTSFDLDVDCVEPYPDPDIMGARTCQGVTDPVFDLTALDYRHFHDWDGDDGDLPVRCEPASIVLLIDMSGSIRGFVDPDNEYREGPDGSYRVPDEERVRVASDGTNGRLSAAADLIRDLNANDELVALSFRETPEGENLRTLCSIGPLPPEGALASEPEYVRQALQCFGHNRDIVVDEVRAAFGDERGRTPLWEAVLAAFELLDRDDLGATDNRHVIVVTDGPDTCAAGSIERLQTGASACSDTGYEAVFDRITAHNADPTKAPVRVHFVQLQARGYPRRDARQMELACATQGLYQFVNGDNFQRTSSGNPPPEYGEAIREALLRVRDALSGYWTLTVETAAFDVQPAAPADLARGAIHGVSGSLVFEPDLQELTRPVAFVEPFGAWGQNDWGAWDLRVAFRRMCLADTDCVAEPAPCHWYCAPQEGVCLESPVEMLDGTPCALSETSIGECHDAVCQVGSSGSQ